MYVWNPSNFRVAYASSAGNADTVDGIDSTGFLRYYNSNSAPSNVDIVNTPSYVWTVSTTGGSVANATKPSGVDNAWGVIHLHTHIGNYATQLGFGGTTNRMYMRNAYNTSTFGNWQALAFITDIPTSLPANGGNADTVDGYHSSSFLTKHTREGAYNIDHLTDFVTRDLQPKSEINIEGTKPYDGWGIVTVLKTDNGTAQLVFDGGNNFYFRSSYGTENRYVTSAWKQVAALDSKVADSDKLDGIHANGLLTALSNSDKGISITVGGTTKSVSNISVNYASSAGNADTVDGYHATDGRTFTGNINWSPNWNDTWSDGTNNHPWYGFDHRYPNTGAYSTTISDFFGMTIKTANTLRLDFGTLLLNGPSIYSINVASATKLQTSRTIWGQPFNGTADVNGTIYINNSDSSNGAIRLNNNVNSNARISAISDQVIFNTGNAIRFGETAWDWNQWAGLKYTHSNKTIYLGIADNSVFNANSAQSNGTLRLAGITTITPDSDARIGGSGGDLYLGNANNSGWVKVQDMCSQVDSDNWVIYQDGSAYFDNISINTSAYIDGNLEAGQIIREGSG